MATRDPQPKTAPSIRGKMPRAKPQRPPQDLIERTPLGPLPLPFQGGGGREITVTTRSTLTREYVTSRGWAWLTQYASTLPQYVDDVTRQFGRDLYSRKMRHDPQVESALSTLIMAALAQGLAITPNVDKGTGGFEDSKAICDFCLACVDRLERPITDTFYEMGLGIGYGYKIAEQIYQMVDWPQFPGPRLVLKALHTKPQDTTAFVVDAYNNVLGLIYTRLGQPTPQVSTLSESMFYLGDSQESYIPDAKNPLIVPRHKFWIFSWQPENNDPRGTSILRPAYHPWWVKAQVWRSYLAFLATFAQPSVIGYVSPNAEPNYIYDAEGNPIPLQTPQEVMKTALEAIQNGAVGAFAADERVELLQPRSEGAAFIQAINMANREITKAVIRQTLTTEEGEHMARAASEVHQDVFGLLVRYTKSTLVGSFRRDVLAPLIAYNYGEAAARDYMPICTLGETEHQDFANDANAVAALVKAGFFDESQYRGLDEYLGLPKRDPELWAKKLAQAEALVELSSQTNTGGPVSGPPGAPPAGAGAGAGAQPASGQSSTSVSAETAGLTTRQVAKSSAMRIANRVGTVGPG